LERSTIGGSNGGTNLVVGGLLLLSPLADWSGVSHSRDGRHPHVQSGSTRMLRQSRNRQDTLAILANLGLLEPTVADAVVSHPSESSVIGPLHQDPWAVNDLNSQLNRLRNARFHGSDLVVVSILCLKLSRNSRSSQRGEGVVTDDSVGHGRRIGVDGSTRSNSNSGIPLGRLGVTSKREGGVGGRVLLSNRVDVARVSLVEVSSGGSQSQISSLARSNDASITVQSHFSFVSEGRASSDCVIDISDTNVDESGSGIARYLVPLDLVSAINSGNTVRLPGGSEGSSSSYYGRGGGVRHSKAEISSGLAVGQRRSALGTNVLDENDNFFTSVARGSLQTSSRESSVEGSSVGGRTSGSAERSLESGATGSQPNAVAADEHLHVVRVRGQRNSESTGGRVARYRCVEDSAGARSNASTSCIVGQSGHREGCQLDAASLSNSLLAVVVRSWSPRHSDAVGRLGAQPSTGGGGNASTSAATVLLIRSVNYTSGQTRCTLESNPRATGVVKLQQGVTGDSERRVGSSYGSGSIGNELGVNPEESRVRRVAFNAEEDVATQTTINDKLSLVVCSGGPDTFVATIRSWSVAIAQNQLAGGEVVLCLSSDRQLGEVRVGHRGHIHLIVDPGRHGSCGRALDATADGLVRGNGDDAGSSTNDVQVIHKGFTV